MTELGQKFSQSQDSSLTNNITTVSRTVDLDPKEALRSRQF